MKRREFLGAIAAPVIAAPALIGMTRKSPRAIAGGFVDDGGARGHQIRDGLLRGARGTPRRVPVAIVGGGVAGLSAARELHRSGMRDFVLLEMEHTSGGNARSGENDITAYPWAAHYVPVPDAASTLVRELFTELGVLRDGVWEERALCFAPQERLFLHGEWHEGVEPAFALDQAGRDDFRRFDEEIAHARGTGEFTIPMAGGARRNSPLDALSMAEWMAHRQLTSPALRWYVDYACRDDYGALAAQTSAWAGLHYFASRSHEEAGPLTWADGTGWIAKRMAAALTGQMRLGEPALHVAREGTRWRIDTPAAAYLADAVIFAAPTFLVPRVIPALAARTVPLVYSPWLTANLTLERWPAERGRGVPPSWDNVLYDSPALGYVIATHQSVRTHVDRTVWTYYWALAGMTPLEGRRVLQRRSWQEWTDLILADLARAHPDIRDCVSRVDIMRMGHAMVRPTVGFLRDTSRTAVALALPGLYLANSDLSGLSLFEEAQYRGVTAAARVAREPLR